MFEGQWLSVPHVCGSIFADLRDIMQLQFKGTIPAVPDWPCLVGMVARLRREYTTLVVHWNRPVPHVVKLNSDGCVRGIPGKSGGGGMLRCLEGRFILGYSCCFGETTSLHAELKALLFGVRLAISRGYVNLHIESDSLGLVQIIQGTVQCAWRLRRDLQDLLEDRRCFREVSHCFREANKPADRLANIGVDSSSSSTYESFCDLPALVRGDLTLDRVGLPSFRRVRRSKLGFSGFAVHV